MRKVIGVNNLIDYLISVNYPLNEVEINELLEKKQLPHLRPMRDIIVFNLDYIDSWIQERTSK